MFEGVREKGNFKSTYLFLFFSTFIVSKYLKFFCKFYGHELCCVRRILFMKLTDKLMFGFKENQFLLHVNYTLDIYQFMYTASDFLKA